MTHIYLFQIQKYGETILRIAKKLTSISTWFKAKLFININKTK